MDLNNYTNGFELTVPSTVQTAFCDRTMTAEISQDFVLPDYQPEMRKLLRVTPTIQPPSRFLGVGEAEFAGNVVFTLLYLGGDGAPYTAELTAPYTFRIPIEGDDRLAGDRPLGISAEMTADSVTPRLSAPRKLNIKCRLHAHITGLCDEETDIRREGAEGETEKLERTRLCARTVFAVGEVMELTDEFSAPVGEGELRLIGHSGTVQITEAIPTEGGIACRGELYLKLMMTRDRAVTPDTAGESPEIISIPSGEAKEEILVRRLPFSQTVEMSLPAQNGWEAMAYGCCTGITARVEEDRILCAATVALEAQAQGNEKVTFVCDCFSTEHRTLCEMRTYPYRRALACINGNVTEGGSVSAAELGIPQGSAPLDLAASAVLTGVTCERGHAILSGDCLYQMLYRTPEGELGNVEFRLPLRYEIPGESRYCEEEMLGADARMVMLSGRVRPEGDGSSYTVDAEWAIAARLFAKERIEAVDCARFEGEHPPRRGTYLLCYPASDDSLWGVAKRYHSPLRPLAALNDLPGAADPASPMSLEGVKFLMIG